ncbi:hypothetical protein Zmor_023080 [Zophobas morio]|uniref:Uncharacterized protein n=1 Tax=Zophobas morio TaxID=2755281 RepID=A0AA38HXH7_9CUCU|nr:hypothetical protein Zmor_023080 [Zophobas morio]
MYNLTKAMLYTGHSLRRPSVAKPNYCNAPARSTVSDTLFAEYFCLLNSTSPDQTSKLSPSRDLLMQVTTLPKCPRHCQIELSPCKRMPC